MRLGDLDALLDKFLRSYTEQEKVGNFQFVACEIKQGFADMVCEQPTIDAVPVVRCKDCDWYREEESICVNPHCSKSYYGCRVRQEHFCSYGERKEADSNAD